MKNTFAGTTLALLLLGTTGASAGNIVETAQDAGTFKTLLAAAQAAGLADALSNNANLTVFAPTDEAFAALPEGTVENLLQPENKELLTAILSYHVVPSVITSDMIASGTSEVSTIKSSGDQQLTVSNMNGSVTVDGANVVSADIRADNGVIHVIDKVMMPSD